MKGPCFCKVLFLLTGWIPYGMIHTWSERTILPPDTSSGFQKMFFYLTNEVEYAKLISIFDILCIFHMN